MTEMDKLDAMLSERGIEHTYGRRFPEMDELVSKEPDLFKGQDWGTQIIVYDGEMRAWDAICGYTRLSIIFSGYLFSLLYELMSGYLRGFGISLAPAVLTTLGVCGIRIFWVQAVFPRHADFQTLMLVYPLSLFVTAVLILAALIVCRPTTRMKKQEKKEISA